MDVEVVGNCLQVFWLCKEKQNLACFSLENLSVKGKFSPVQE